MSELPEVVTLAVADAMAVATALEMAWLLPLLLLEHCSCHSGPKAISLVLRLLPASNISHLPIANLLSVPACHCNTDLQRLLVTCMG